MRITSATTAVLDAQRDVQQDAALLMLLLVCLGRCYFRYQFLPFLLPMCGACLSDATCASCRACSHASMVSGACKTAEQLLNGKTPALTTGFQVLDECYACM
jgi:hypothetical protein